MKWIAVMARILFYFSIGVVLFYSPWTSIWSNNFFLAHYAWIAAAAHNDFVRGAISGIGLANIWLAIDVIHGIGRPPDPIPTRPLR